MKKLTIISIVLLMAVICVAGVIAGGNNAAPTEEVALVSKGLSILAERSTMAKTGVTGRELTFSPDDFERALNTSRVDYITLTEVPDPAIGTLCLGSAELGVGQTVSRENLHKLSYVAKGEGISSNSFSFTTGNGYEIECAVYILAEENYCPTATGAKLFTSVSTYRNVSVYGDLTGSDAEGDPITFEVVSYPKNGSVIITDTSNGEFCYTPAKDYVGKDSFMYVVYDKYGNYSAAKEVEVMVDRVSLDGVLCDMGGNRAHSAAITMVEEGIMSATEGEDGKLVFAPNETVTREDFLVMTMKAASIKITEANSTGFADDADISAMAKSYVYTAKEKGYIKGTQVDGKYYFYPENTITSAEAAVIVNNIIGGAEYVGSNVAITTVFSDHLDIPAWAEDSILTLNYIGIWSSTNGYVYPQSKMTKADTALVLAAVMNIND